VISSDCKDEELKGSYDCMGVTSKSFKKAPMEDNSMDGTHYNEAELASFVDGLRGAAVHLRELNPSFYLVSLNGGLPLFDALTIIDRSLNPEQAVYFPGSSKIRDCANVLTRCFQNFFLEKKDQSADVRKLASIDEVVSGNSVERLFNAYNTASRMIARAHLGSSQRMKELVELEARDLRANFPLKVLGVKEMRGLGNRMAPTYQQRVKDGEVIEFPIERIITMDEKDFETIEFESPPSTGFTQGYMPRVKSAPIKAKYMALLRDIARYVGADPERIVLPSRTRIASDCDKYARRSEF